MNLQSSQLNPNITKSTRNAQVDFLRGVAILVVLLLHFTLAFGMKNSLFALVFGEKFSRALVYNGNYGVTLFFVISGFLITSMSLARWGSLDRIRPRTFYLYRFARIMPSLVLALAIITLLGCLGVPYFTNADGGHHLPASYFIVAIGSVLTFWHNALMQSQGWFNYCLNIYWSLSVEEVFYLALPVACLLLRRNWLFVLVCVAVVIYAPLYRAAHIDNELFWECGYAACFDAIALGCLTAMLARKWTIVGRRAGLMRGVAALGFAVTYLIGIDGHEIFGFTIVALCAAVYLLASATDTGTSLATGRMTRPLRWLGQHSYELYLFHIVILALLRNVYTRGELGPWAWGLWLALFVSLSTLVAFVVARYISEPANRAIRRVSVDAHDAEAASPSALPTVELS
jgi:peptidoglycan/LPS O-acetylase OafA/YrhL